MDALRRRRRHLSRTITRITLDCNHLSTQINQVHPWNAHTLDERKEQTRIRRELTQTFNHKETARTLLLEELASISTPIRPS